MAPEFAYLIMPLAGIIALFVLGMMVVAGSISKRCDGCGVEFIDEFDLITHKKSCSHCGTEKISKAA